MLAVTKNIWDIIPKNHKLVLWCNFDTGANTHIVNNSKYISNFQSTPNKFLRVANGRNISVTGKGDWTIKISEATFVLRDTLCMPTNPNCTLSTGNLKRHQGFTQAPHDSFDSFTLVHKSGNKIVFCTQNKNLKMRNAIDYVAIETIPPNKFSDKTSFLSPPHPPSTIHVNKRQHTTYKSS